MVTFGSRCLGCYDGPQRALSVLLGTVAYRVSGHSNMMIEVLVILLIGIGSNGLYTRHFQTSAALFLILVLQPDTVIAAG
jgi:hypothetical protein